MFLKGVLLPILLAVVSLALIIAIVNALFRLAQLDIWILRVVGVLIVWYFVGPVLLNWLTDILNIEVSDGIRILYTSIQSIMDKFNKIV